MRIQIREDDLHLDPDFPFLVQELVLTKAEDRKSEYHWHSFFEITRVEQGRILYYVEDRMYEVGPGDYMIFNQAEPHGWEVCGQQAKIRFTIFTPREELTCNYQNCIRQGSAGVDEVAAVLDDIYREWNTREDSWREILRLDSQRLVTILRRHFPDETRPAGPVVQRQQVMRRLERALSYMHANFSRPVPLETAAGLCGLSPNYFCALFHQTMGIRFGTYMQNLRVRHATKLLHTTNRTILDIALECGYENESNFYRQYRKAMGHSPGEERKMSRSGNQQQ